MNHRITILILTLILSAGSLYSEIQLTAEKNGDDVKLTVTNFGDEEINFTGFKSDPYDGYYTWSPFLMRFRADGEIINVIENSEWWTPYQLSSIEYGEEDHRNITIMKTISPKDSVSFTIHLGDILPPEHLLPRDEIDTVEFSWRFLSEFPDGLVSNPIQLH